MKKLLIGLAVLLLAGCGQTTELKELEIVTAAAVSTHENGVELALQLVNQDSALSAYQAKSCRYFTGQGENLQAAVEDIRRQGVKKPTFAHNRLYIIDEKFLASEMVGELVVSGVDIRPGAFLAVAKEDSAAGLLTGKDAFDVNTSFLLTNTLEAQKSPALSDFYLALAGEVELALPMFSEEEGEFKPEGSVVIKKVKAGGGAGD